jgi:solute carrier family 25 carnitine/acylcarnitine transporter 20/29
VPGLYHGLSATLLFRTFFCVWWGSYDVITRSLTAQTILPLSVPAVNFLAGGLSAQLFWIAAYPSDVVKQRIMTASLTQRRGMNVGMWRRTAREVYANQGWKGFWRGFLPCFLRAFPANAMALGVFEGAMRMLP